MSTTDIAIPYTQRVESIEAVAAAGQNGFFLPWGTYVRAADILSVEVDGVLWPCAPGNSYVPMERQKSMVWPQPSTADVVRGVWLVPFASFVGGETVRITFVVRDLLIAPPVPSPAYAPGNVLPPGNAYWSYRAGNPNWKLPFQVVVAARAGLSVEFWRKSRKPGGTRTPGWVPGGIPQIRFGRHWSPYWRSVAAVADGIQAIDPAASGFLQTATPSRRDYRLAYYDPSSGARSDLSDVVLYVGRRPDNLRTVSDPPPPAPSIPMHPQNSIWIGK